MPTCQSELFKKRIYYALMFVHAVPIVFLTIYTALTLVPAVLPSYLLFSVLFLTSTLIALNTILESRAGTFYYLLNLMFLLGFWLKYSVHKLTGTNYRDPIGGFVSSPVSEAHVLWVVICGLSGFLLAQILSRYSFKKTGTYSGQGREPARGKRMMLILLLSVVVLAVLNLKFNILLSGLLPDVAFSFKGNAIYYLALTRGVLFLFFFYCFRGYSSNLVFWGAVIASIASIGVLSRMVIVFYFAVVFVQILQALPGWRIREVAVNILFFLAILAGFSYLTVLGSSGVRDIIYTKISMQQKQEVAPVEPAAVDTGSPLIVAPPVSLTQAFNFKEKLGVYKGLAMGRWIGMEGVMAVHAYPSKSFAFLWEALKEKSYHGSPFYHMVLIPGYVPDSAVGRLFSASVPGPIAFAYYSGSFIFVFLALFLAAYFMSGIEYLAIKFFDEAQPAVLFISSFMVADFFQFGIAPQSFVKYWVFSFAAIAAFVFLTGLRKPPPLADCAPVKLR